MNVFQFLLSVTLTISVLSSASAVCLDNPIGWYDIDGMFWPLVCNQFGNKSHHLMLYT